MTLDEDLVRAVDRVVKRLNTTRSAFTRTALRDAIANLQTRKLEAEHRRGYEDKPPGQDEFSIWEDEQAWGN
jgi:metal-responsive CopG/Arc/MetJ family transcriptional regulator